MPPESSSNKKFLCFCPIVRDHFDLLGSGSGSTTPLNLGPLWIQIRNIAYYKLQTHQVCGQTLTNVRYLYLPFEDVLYTFHYWTKAYCTVLLIWLWICILIKIHINWVCGGKKRIQEMKDYFMYFWKCFFLSYGIWIPIQFLNARSAFIDSGSSTASKEWNNPLQATWWVMCGKKPLCTPWF